MGIFGAEGTFSDIQTTAKYEGVASRIFRCAASFFVGLFLPDLKTMYRPLLCVAIRIALGNCGILGRSPGRLLVHLGSPDPDNAGIRPDILFPLMQGMFQTWTGTSVTINFLEKQTRRSA